MNNNWLNSTLTFLNTSKSKSAYTGYIKVYFYSNVAIPILVIDSSDKIFPKEIILVLLVNIAIIANHIFNSSVSNLFFNY